MSKSYFKVRFFTRCSSSKMQRIPTRRTRTLTSLRPQCLTPGKNNHCRSLSWFQHSVPGRRNTCSLFLYRHYVCMHVLGSCMSMPITHQVLWARQPKLSQLLFSVAVYVCLSQFEMYWARKPKLKLVISFVLELFMCACMYVCPSLSL